MTATIGCRKRALLRPTAVRHASATLTTSSRIIRENVAHFRSLTDATIMAVVKADGFGAGATDVARSALAGGAAWLGTATIDEAVALRTAGLNAPTLAWLPYPGTDWEAAARLNIDVGIGSLPDLREAASAAARVRTRSRVHLHIDVGLAREGASKNEWLALVALAADLECAGQIEVVGLMGHLPCASQPSHPTTDDALKTFDWAWRTTLDAGIQPVLRHVAATQGALTRPDTHFDMVRIGAGLHGIGAGLQQGSSLKTSVSLVRPVPQGTPVGYGHRATTAEPTILATLPIGYADGIPRDLRAGAAVQIDGRRCPVIGAPSMDQLVVDVGPAGCQRGATATVFGSGASGEPTLEDWAFWADTIEQDILARVGARVDRALEESI